jgi:hypothetical protein
MGEQQKTRRVLDGGGLGEARMTAARGAEPMAADPETESPSACDRLMEEVCERGNLQRALKRVKANKGAPGVDGMTVQALPAYLREHWPSIRASLLEGTYTGNALGGVASRVDATEPIPSVTSITGTNAVGAAASISIAHASFCFALCLPIQRRSWLALTPAFSAMPATDTPDCRHASINRCLSRSSYLRFPSELTVTTRSGRKSE